MKNLIVMYSFLKQNIMPILIIILTTTTLLFILVSLWCQILYTQYMKSIFVKAPDLKHSIYFQYNEQINQSETKEDILINISTYSGFNKLIYFNKVGMNCNNIPNYSSIAINCYSNDMISNFRLDVSEGRWLSNNTDKVEIVLYGDELSGVSIGQTIILDNSIYATVVGRVAYDLIPSFSTSAPNYETSYFFTKNKNSILIINSDLISEKYYTGEYNYYQSQGVFICLNENATNNEKSNILNHLSNYGSVNDYNTIIKNTNKTFEKWAAFFLPLPVFFLIIATVSMLSVSAIIIKRSMNEQAKYYLMGCSKRKSVFLLSMSLTYIFSLPCLINIFLIAFHPEFLRKDTLWDLSSSILNIWSVVPLVIYLLFIISFLTILSISFYNKHSPLSFYRRNI